MRHLPKIVISTAAAVILLMFIFPPYYGMKLPRTENLHAFIGYHPIWSPPTPAYAYQVLHGRPYETGELQNATDTKAGGEKESLDSYVVEFNKVRLIFNIIVVFLVTSIVLLLNWLLKRVRRPVSQ